MRAQAPIVCPLLPVPRFLGAPAHCDGTSRSHCAVLLSLRGEPPRSFLRAPSPSSTAAATSPQPHPRLLGAGGVVAFGATKLRDF